MAGVMIRRWLPAALVVGAGAASLWARGRLPKRIEMQFEGLLPFAGTAPPETAARWAILWLIPVLALLVFALFRVAPTAAGQRLGRRLFRHAPAEVTSPAQFERFGSTYDAIVLGVVLLLVGMHAALLAAALQAPALAVRILPAVLGVCLVLMGNVMPRLRPNWVAGLRSRRLLEDPQLWRRTHRVFGAAFVVSGLATIGAAVAAPVYGVIVAVVSIVVSCLIGWLASMRDGGTGRRASLAVLFLACASASDVTLAVPRSVSVPLPVVLIVAGSGVTASNANGPAPHTNAYAQLARGWRSTALPACVVTSPASRWSYAEGDPATLTIDRYVADATAAAALAADARFSSVILLEHSEGASHVLHAANRVRRRA